MKAEIEEICLALISHASTKREAIAAAIELYPSYSSDIKRIITREWNKKPSKVINRKISLRGRTYNEISEILLSIQNRMNQEVIKGAELNIIKCLRKDVPSDLRAILCKNNEPIEKISGKTVRFVSFNRAILVVSDENGIEYQMLVWDIKKTFIQELRN